MLAHNHPPCHEYKRVCSAWQIRPFCHGRGHGRCLIDFSLVFEVAVQNFYPLPCISVSSPTCPPVHLVSSSTSVLARQFVSLSARLLAHPPVRQLLRQFVSVRHATAWYWQRHSSVVLVPRGRQIVSASFSSSYIRRRCRTAVVVRGRDTGGYMLLLASWSPRASSVHRSRRPTTSFSTLSVHRWPHRRHCRGHSKSWYRRSRWPSLSRLVAAPPSSMSGTLPPISTRWPRQSIIRLC